MQTEPIRSSGAASSPATSPIAVSPTAVSPAAASSAAMPFVAASSATASLGEGSAKGASYRKTGAKKNVKYKPGASGSVGGALRDDVSVRVDINTDNYRVFDNGLYSQDSVLSGHSAADAADVSASKNAQDAASATAPDVEAFTAAVHVFADAYNTLSDAFYWDQSQYHSHNHEMEKQPAEMAEILRAAVYQPVLPDEHSARRVSLYEIGVAHSPNGQTAGRLTVNDAKLAAAVRTRENDVQALFAGISTDTNASTGENLPARLRALLQPFLTRTDSEYLRVCGSAFLVACDELQDFFISTE